jgi:outer membrane PBP1 activator LpoA protein
MFNLLALNMDSEGIKLCLYYGACFLIILLALIVMGCLNRKTKKEIRAEKVKTCCIDAKEYAQEMLRTGGHKGKHLLLGATKLLRLQDRITDAAWYAFQIATNKKDIVFEGIANQLDALANTISNAAADGYVSLSDYESCIGKTIETLDVVIEQLNHENVK